MAVTISTSNPGTMTQIERTASVEFQTPVGGYAMLIHREVIDQLADGRVISRRFIPDAFYEPVADVAKRPATAAYLAACKRATSPTDLIAAMAQWCDDLVAEKRAEAAPTDEEGA